MNATVKRPFKMLGIQQIAIGGPDKQRLQKLWVDMLGLAVTGTFKSERENVDEDICAMGDGPTAIEVDLMQPLDPDKKPAVHTTPLNHVGLWIDDLAAAVAWLERRDFVRRHDNRSQVFPTSLRAASLDEALRAIYSNGKVDFSRLERVDIDALLKTVKTGVNARLGGELVKDVLVKEFNYVRKDQLRG